ncbi:MAG: chorismate synthase [Bacteroidetes bacterium GWC2_33_15]|nr:MAG: chorismate synthase [Bacteroidetes bacterium GWA2_33_15]OFX49717.1 MAG: chorismate synthase [Bacteroidetes bacterium GWC2_33_15]OFX65893.1 MAG: chorismate synthase [Bacteroidetes bacterium GWB2_32_14]OFX68346.1 MAG: chorismate synthase [Bacteroidetes bacterium GWD2_33_33]HAN18134.1 chorismate synthase [Bacteroidales bacterium]
MNTFGRIFRIHIYGESHGKEIGILIDGCPAGLPITIEDFTEDIQRRKGGAKGTTPRIEEDKPIIKSGVFNGKTTGTPVLISFENKDVHSEDYRDLLAFPRPGHADFTAKMKFGGYNDHRGGGHFSGRLTLGLIVAGVIAKKLIAPVKINATVIETGGSKNIDSAIDKAIKENDSIGGIVECRADNVPVGLGEPFFDSFESLISHIVFAIPAIKGIEFGSGFSSAQMTGSGHNDAILESTGKTKTNYSGGINGGITNGNEIYYRVAVKPTSSISKPQQTLNLEKGKTENLEIKGRHDTCIALRVPVILEAATAIVLADLMMLEQRIPGIVKEI